MNMVIIIRMIDKVRRLWQQNNDDDDNDDDDDDDIF